MEKECLREFSVKTIAVEEKGALSFFEGEREAPFAIKRIYYIHDVPAGVRRGGHAHKKLRQVLFCPYGRILITLDDGEKRTEVLLDGPEKALVIGPGLWRDMLWMTDNAVLCVAASEYYDETDYIRDYQAFLTYLSKGGDRA